MWNGELGEKKKKKQTRWTSRPDMKTSGGGQRWGRSQEKEGGMHGARQGITRERDWDERT